MGCRATRIQRCEISFAFWRSAARRLRTDTGPLAHLRKPPIRCHEALNHRRDQLGGLDGLPVFATKNLGISEEIAVKSRGQFHRNLHRLVVFERSEFSLAHRSASEGFEHPVSSHN